MSKKIAWLLPPLLESSGGIGNIFDKIRLLGDNGYECHIYVDSKDNTYELIELAYRYYGDSKAVIHSGWQVQEKFDLIVATAWYSAEIVKEINQKCLKMYFIQDFEAYFDLMGDGYILAENSYKLGLIPMTMGRYLSYKFKSEYGFESSFVDICANEKRYFKIKNFQKKELSVCFIHQPDKPRRCSNIGLLALKLLKKEIPEVNIYLYGSNHKSLVDFEHINLGMEKLEKLNELYNKCSVGLCICSSNPSRIPFEFMSAGLPVVDIYRENNFYDIPEQSVLLAEPTPESIKKALSLVLKNSSIQQSMSKYGLEFMKKRFWDVESKQFLAFIGSVFNKNKYSNKSSFLKKIYNKKAIIER